MYATQTDITNLYGEELLYVLADRDRDQVLDTAAINAAIEFGAAQVRTYLSKRYSDAQLAASQDVKRLVVEIAVFRLALQADALTVEIRTRYEEALRQMELMARGTIGIGVPEEMPQAASDLRDGDILVFANERAFTRDKMRGL